MTDVIRAILKIKTDAQVTVSGPQADLDACEIVWLDDNPTSITTEQIQAKMDEFAYQDKRKKEYPSIVNQLDDLYHNGIDGWKATIKVTKDKYPK